MSCAMICSNLIVNIWPMPTGTVSLGSNSLTFGSDQIQFNVQSVFKEATRLLTSAYDIFDFDLKLLEKQNTHFNENDNQTKGENVNRKTATTKHNCDINKFIINAEIQTMADVYLHMDIDESYELNVTSECSL